MKSLILFLLLAGACRAQSPVIVQKFALENETHIKGSFLSPITIFTPTQNGLYRMTLYIAATDSQTVEICPSSPSNLPNTGCARTDGLPSSVVAFTAKAGEPIGYFTADLSSHPYTGTYSAYIAIEFLF